MRTISLALTLMVAGCSNFFTPPLIQGQVLDEGGKGIPGAVISDGKTSTCTNEDGKFELQSSSKSLKVHKSRYLPGDYPIKYNTFTLRSNPNPVTVAWDLRWSENITTGAQSHLNASGFKVIPFKTGVPDADVWVIPCPAQLSTQAIEQAQQWVKQGKTLVVFGEWGGYPSFAQESTNTLLKETGMRFSGSTVRQYDPQDKERPEWVLVQGFTSHSMLKSVSKGIQLFTAGSLDVEAPGRIFAQTASDSYRIAAFAKGAQIVAAYAPLGYGKVIAWTDTSFLMDTDSRGEGVPDWKTSDNPQILINTLNW